MSEREHLVVALVKDVLGPREGPDEYLLPDRDPRDEYIVGVLAPEQRERFAYDPDADIDEIIEEVTDDEQQSTEGIIIAPPSAFAPALDPKAQPRSVGLSFVVAADSGQPQIDICATWARYLPQQEGGWRRTPDAFVEYSVVATQHAHWPQAGPDVDLYLRVRQQPDGSYRVSVYLVNQRSIPDGQRPTTPDYVFQPQIRVRCRRGTRLEPLVVTPTTANELTQDDLQLAMLYRERAALARGHMCGATWKKIDPETPPSNTGLEIPPVAPFAWTDRGSVSSEEQDHFSPADVRTEFLPCYPIESPAMYWPEQYSPAPQLDPEALAETWHPDQIRAALEPLVQGYSSWIDDQQAEIAALRPEWRELAQVNIDTCRSVAQRIQDGIEWLIQDEDVRLAFCFANQSIALQSRWSRGQAYPWRPFQLAFILLNITALADPLHEDREICDLLWFPTGGGKTEAYLGLAAFTLALRRRQALTRTRGDRSGGGVGVLSRYTLRLLTIQQFRRALSVITACEYLRVAHLAEPGRPVGWRPRACTNTTNFLWGGVRFSVGLWVGGGVTPNSLMDFEYRVPSGAIHHAAGALEILQGVSQRRYEGYDPDLQRKLNGKTITAEGEPAQVLTCPACQELLAIPEDGLKTGQHTLHFMFLGTCSNNPFPSIFNTAQIAVDSAESIPSSVPGISTFSITFTIGVNQSVSARDIDRWWYDVIVQQLPSTPSATLIAARPARPGYVLSTYNTQTNTTKPNTFEIYCPNPTCVLNQTPWAEQVPINVASPGGRGTDQRNSSLLPTIPALEWQTAAHYLRLGQHRTIAHRMPIPAYTTDDQIYHRCPSMVIATVDKFARLAFEPKAGSLFGNVSHYHARWGYYREGCPPSTGGQSSPETPESHPARSNPGRANNLSVSVPVFTPPDLIIQDELHLLEGPLGSMVGLYETAVDALCARSDGHAQIRPKYVASTATVRQAENQVASLFARRLTQFPPSALVVDERFFATTKETHPLESSKAGRLYIALAAPGKGAQTPIVRIWSALLQAAQDRRSVSTGDELDPFWTLVGYFNALRELAGATALYRQDIRERLRAMAGTAARTLADQALELSSRANSLALPGLLSRLEQKWAEDAVLATSMFGTGVDVDRLGLMVVHGQPKTTSAYIQATGRVGRQQGGLVVTFFRASRPRDLDHYEFFTGYHRMLYRAVEPITVTPYAPRARERGLGPLAVALLRQATAIDGNAVEHPWHIQQRIRNGIFSQAALILQHRRHPALEAIPGLFEQRAMQQPEGRRPYQGITAIEVESELDRWRSIANDCAQSGGTLTDQLVYSEPSMLRDPVRSVVLGDAQHQLRQLPVAFENAPTSLRDVEETTQFKG